MSHGDKVTKLPEGFVVTASTANAPIAAMEDPQRRLYGVQFHPEVTHTAKGDQLFSVFARDICGCEGSWTAENIVEDAIAIGAKFIWMQEGIVHKGAAAKAEAAGLIVVMDRCTKIDHMNLL